MTKISNEMMDSTICATVRIFLQFKDYESLFRILSDQENYGIFPDEFLYNILMDHFIEQKMYKGKNQHCILFIYYYCIFRFRCVTYASIVLVAFQ